MDTLTRQLLQLRKDAFPVSLGEIASGLGVDSDAAARAVSEALQAGWLEEVNIQPFETGGVGPTNVAPRYRLSAEGIAERARQ